MTYYKDSQEGLDDHPTFIKNFGPCWTCLRESPFDYLSNLFVALKYAKPGMFFPACLGCLGPDLSKMSRDFVLLKFLMATVGFCWVDVC